MMIEIMRKYQKRYPKDDESMKKGAVTSKRNYSFSENHSFF